MKKKLAELEAEVQSEIQTEHWEPVVILSLDAGKFIFN